MRRCFQTHHHTRSPSTHTPPTPDRTLKAEWVAEAAAAKQALRSIDNLVAAELNVSNNVNGSDGIDGGGERTPGARSGDARGGRGGNGGGGEGRVSPETVRRLAGLKKKMKQRVSDLGGAGGAAGGGSGGIGGSDVRVVLGRRTSPTGKGRGGRGEAELYMSMESTVSLSDAEGDDGE